MSEKKYCDSSCGDKFYTPIEYVYDDKCKTYIPKEGKRLNRFEMIQASKPSCDINIILKRAMAGDPMILTAMQAGANFEGNFGDISDIPDNINDMHNFNVEAMNSFYKLDPNIRKLFDNDVNKFSKAIEDGTYVSVINNALNVDSKDSNVVEEEGAK